MGATEQSMRSKNAAAALRKRGIVYGKRLSTPYPNSGGLTMTPGPGSTRYQRLVASQRKS